MHFLMKQIEFSNQFLVRISVRYDFTNQVQVENIVLKPGENAIQLSAKATRVGLWHCKQVCLFIRMKIS